MTNQGSVKEPQGLEKFLIENGIFERWIEKQFWKTRGTVLPII